MRLSYRMQMLSDDIQRSLGMCHTSIWDKTVWQLKALRLSKYVMSGKSLK